MKGKSKKVIVLLGLSVLIIGLYTFLGTGNHSSAEMRAFPFSEEFLLENVHLIFIGKVLEIETFEQHERMVPKKAQVLLSIKGKLKADSIINVVPKHPGGFVYFKEEFDQGVIDKVGIFYVGCTKYTSNPNILMKYKEIPVK